MEDSFNRRGFLGAAAAGGALLAGQVLGPIVMAAEAEAVAALPPVRIHKVYVGRRGQAWPKPEIDLQAEVARFERVLAEAEPRLGDVRFVGGELVQSQAEAANLVARLGEADAVLMFHLTLGTGGLMGQIVNANKPAAVFSQPFSGHEWMDVRAWQRAGKRVALFATSDYGELTQAAALLRVPARLRQTRIVLVGNPWSSFTAEQLRARYGAEVVPVTVQQVIEAHRAVDAQAAEAEADQWMREARRVVEPTRDEIIKSSRMFLAMRRILAEQRAQAITIACLGGIPINVLGYPCLGFARLCDLGLVGACEADLDSTLTMLIFAYAFRSPGFITDPLFDLSKSAVIHAHCVSPTRMAGPGGERCPYLIRTHRDDNRGASLEVEMRVGQAITCAKIVGLETMLLSTGRIIEITDFDDRGCRTQITTEVANAQKMLDGWGHGLHRVVFYGDRRGGVRHLAALLGFRIVEENA